MDRRTFIGAAAASPLIGTEIAFAQTTRAPNVPLPSLATAEPVIDDVRRFLERLEPAKRKAASFAFDSPAWRRWDYFGASGYTKPGLRLEQMTADEKAAAWQIFQRVLSPAGVAKAQNVMRLQETLIEEGDAPTQRSAERFSVSIFGTPEARGAFGFRLEGHHLSLSFAVRDGQIVSVTPQAFAVRPARVTRGRHKGLITIGPEEDLARQIMADLPPPLQAKARVADRHLFNILSTAGRERANIKAEGLSAGALSRTQQDLVRELVRTYAVAPYAGALASAQSERLAATRIDDIHFAWYGDNTSGRAFGYRVIAPTFVIEMGSIDSEAQHLHPIYHDLGNVLGTPA